MDPDVQPLRMDQHTLRKDSLDQSSGVPSNNEPTMSQDEQTLQYHIDAVTADDDGEEDLKLTEQVAALYAHLTALASGPGLVPLPQHAQQQQQQIQQPPGDPRERLISFLSPAISPEASGMLFDAGFETLEAVRGLHPGNHSTQDASHDELVGKVGVDLDSIEDYLEKRFKPGHRKQILQVYLYYNVVKYWPNLFA